MLLNAWLMLLFRKIMSRDALTGKSCPTICPLQSSEQVAPTSFDTMHGAKNDRCNGPFPEMLS